MSRPPLVLPTLDCNKAFRGRVAFSGRDRRRRLSAFRIIITAERRPDLIVVGGGAAGLTAAYFAAQHGVQVPFAAQPSAPHPAAASPCWLEWCPRYVGRRCAICGSVAEQCCHGAPDRSPCSSAMRRRAERSSSVAELAGMQLLVSLLQTCNLAAVRTVLNSWQTSLQFLDADEIGCVQQRAADGRGRRP